jgi:hypothetical protein
LSRDLTEAAASHNSLYVSAYMGEVDRRLNGSHFDSAIDRSWPVSADRARDFCSHAKLSAPSADHAKAARNAAQARIEALESSQHAAVPKALLGDTAAVEQLRQLDSQIAALQPSL